MRPPIAAALLAAALLAIVPAAPAPAQEKVNLDIDVGENNGICRIAFRNPARSDDEPPLMMEFSVRARDGNFGAAVKANSWSLVDGQDEERNVPMTLTFADGRSTSSRSGGYSAGFHMMIWGGWGPGPASDEAIAMLEKARTVSVAFDGRDLGAFDLQMTNYAHTWLQGCLERQRGGAAQ